MFDVADVLGREASINRSGAWGKIQALLTSPRPLKEIDADLKQTEEKIMRLLGETTA